MESEVFTWVFALSFIVGLLMLLERLSLNRYMGQSMRRKTGSEAEKDSAVATTSRRSILGWYGVTALAALLLGFVLSNKLSTPVHATLTKAPWHQLDDLMLPCFGAALVVALLALMVQRVHAASASTAMWFTKALAITGVHCIALALVANGINVHFDSSPTTAATAKVIKIVHRKSAKSLNTMELTALNGASESSETMYTVVDYRVFKFDMDHRYANFYWREGYLGRRYAVEYPVAAR